MPELSACIGCLGSMGLLMDFLCLESEEAAFFLNFFFLFAFSSTGLRRGWDANLSRSTGRLRFAEARVRKEMFWILECGKGKEMEGIGGSSFGPGVSGKGRRSSESVFLAKKTVLDDREVEGEKHSRDGSCLEKYFWYEKHCTRR